MSRSARGRGRPVEVVGEVRVLAPTGSSPYYRLTWVEPDGSQGRTTGGRGLKAAVTKARLIDAELNAATEAPKSLTPLVDVIAKYTSTHVGRNCMNKSDWTLARLGQVTRHLHRCLLGAPAVLAAQLDRTTLIAMQAQGGTDRIVKENTTSLRGLLVWGDERVLHRRAGRTAPPRRTATRPVVAGHPRAPAAGARQDRRGGGFHRPR